MRRIVITWPEFFDGEVSEIVRMLTSGSVWRVHVRKPGASTDSVRSLLLAIPQSLRSKITLHYFPELTKECGVGGFHVNAHCPAPPVGWKGLVSASLHSIGEIGKSDYDYAFLSPIFPSISKPGYHAHFNTDELKAAVNDKIFALGGIDEKRMAEVEALGFGGVAMLGSAWRATIDPEKFSLQFITHPDASDSVIPGAEQALAGGCRWIQLRHKNADRATLVSEAKALRRMCSDYGAVFIVDDHVDLVSSIGADGVHLGKNDMAVRQARSILGPQKIIGATANTAADILDARRNLADYIGLGPYRFTTTKEKLSPVLGVDGYRKILSQCRDAGVDMPVVAIGGITLQDIPGIMAAGANGIAVSGAILAASSPESATRKFIETINPLIK